MRLASTLVMFPVDVALTCSKRAPRSADRRSLIDQWSWTNSEWLSTFSTAFFTAGKYWISDSPGTKFGIGRPVESSTGLPEASVIGSARKTYEVGDCELPPVRWLRNH